MPPRAATEIDASLSGEDSATLFALLDATVTPMGSRQLRRWLNRSPINRNCGVVTIHHRPVDGAAEHLRDRCVPSAMSSGS
jgi:hypothetical protein